MKEETVKFCWLDVQSNSDLPLPCYKTENAAGMDICAAVTSSVCLHPGQRMVIGTGLAVAIPYGYEIQVRPRSGLAAKHGITVVNSPGTIDSDYRGELRIALINLGEEKFDINRGDRVAQLVVAPVVRAKIELVDELDTTRRGDGGFGHTGV